MKRVLLNSACVVLFVLIVGVLVWGSPFRRFLRFLRSPRFLLLPGLPSPQSCRSPPSLSQPSRQTLYYLPRPQSVPPAEQALPHRQLQRFPLSTIQPPAAPAALSYISPYMSSFAFLFLFPLFFPITRS